MVQGVGKFIDDGMNFGNSADLFLGIAGIACGNCLPAESDGTGVS